MPQWPMQDEKAQVASALANFDDAVDEVAKAILDGRTYPTSDEVREVVRAIMGSALEDLRGLLLDLGVDPGALAEMVRAHEVGAVPAAMRLVRAGRASAEMTAVDVRKSLYQLFTGQDVDYSAFGLDRKQLTALRTLKSDGKRLLLDQGFEIVHATAKVRMRRAGHRMAEWVVSPNHKQQDICDDLAQAGPYPLNRFPRRPHPHCGCLPGPVEGEAA